MSHWRVLERLANQFVSCIADSRSRDSGDICSTVEGQAEKRPNMVFSATVRRTMWFISTAMHLLLMLCASF